MYFVTNIRNDNNCSWKVGLAANIKQHPPVRSPRAVQMKTLSKMHLMSAIVTARRGLGLKICKATRVAMGLAD